MKKRLETVPPDIAAKIATLEERSSVTTKVLERIEKKLDDLTDRTWQLTIKVAIIGAASGGATSLALKLIHWS